MRKKPNHGNITWAPSRCSVWFSFNQNKYPSLRTVVRSFATFCFKLDGVCIRSLKIEPFAVAFVAFFCPFANVVQFTFLNVWWAFWLRKGTQASAELLRLAGTIGRWEINPRWTRTKNNTQIDDTLYSTPHLFCPFRMGSLTKAYPWLVFTTSHRGVFLFQFLVALRRPNNQLKGEVRKENKKKTKPCPDFAWRSITVFTWKVFFAWVA